MAYRYIESRKIYQVLAILETLFCIVILVYAIKTLLIFDKKSDAFQDNHQIVLYSCGVGIGVSIIQFLSSFGLIWACRGGPSAFDKEDFTTSRIPIICFILAFITFGLHLFIIIGPAMLTEDPLRTYDPNLKTSLGELFTYALVNALFKCIFLWGMGTTIRFKSSSR